MPIVRKERDFSLEEVDQSLCIKTWWSSVAMFPVARHVIRFIVNDTEITPNQITLISILCRVPCILFFLKGDHLSLIAGAVFFELCYFFDCMDGAVARLRNKSSSFGSYVDIVSDDLGVFLCVAALAIGQGAFREMIPLLTLFCFLIVRDVTSLGTNVLIRQQKTVHGLHGADNIAKEYEISRTSEDRFTGFFRLIERYRSFFLRRRLYSFYGVPDVMAVLCFAFPIFNAVEMGFRVAMALLVILIIMRVSTYLIFIKMREVHPGE